MPGSCSWEAPGAQEDQTGRPFVGAAGQKLEQIIAAMGLERDDVYIANILKARPPDNRTPTIDEIEASAPYLSKQLDIIQPEVIITLGAPATKFILQTNEGISRLRGRWGTWEYEGSSHPRHAHISPCLPASELHAGDQEAGLERHSKSR